MDIFDSNLFAAVVGVLLGLLGSSVSERVLARGRMKRALAAEITLTLQSYSDLLSDDALDELKKDLEDPDYIPVFIMSGDSLIVPHLAEHIGLMRTEAITSVIAYHDEINSLDNQLRFLTTEQFKSFPPQRKAAAVESIRQGWASTQRCGYRVLGIEKPRGANPTISSPPKSLSGGET